MLPINKDNPFEISEEEIILLEELAKKHSTNSFHMMAVTLGLSFMGLGRNKETANALRAVADMIESPIATRETREAIASGKLQ